MPSLRDIRRRIRSIKNTARITKAMEMVAAAKMRRAQQRVLAGRPYAETIRAVLADVVAKIPATDDGPINPLLDVRPVRRIGLILITSDRGLAGGFNANMTRRAAQFIFESAVPVSVVTIGRKGRDFMVRLGWDLRADYSNLGDYPTLLDTTPISRVVMDDFRSGYVDEVYLGYSKFVNTMVQRPVIEKLLPIDPPPDLDRTEFLYEPSPEAVLDALVTRYVEMQVYHAVLENSASEHSARMVAMRNATENANEVVNDLTLTANKVRQEVITKELLEIVGGVNALRG
ncbi:MAG: ATP synthase F1 subunit gamma [Chloroflexota bacterium]|nr:ATP synthase F1 subunit gamma [Dehalococcoidia bacterium]MDW8254312.1 ATP synthase F1 subunit gamma [Chloroflexota bacterium]